MGQAKQIGMDCEERGWDDSDNKYVCESCLEDDFLKSIVRSKTEANNCSYCVSGRAAPLEALIPVVFDTIHRYFNNPDQSGVPNFDGDELECFETDEVLEEIGFEPQSSALKLDVVSAIHNDSWIPTAHGHWSELHKHEILKTSWKKFERVVKYECRFNFAGLSDTDEDRETYSPRNFLPRLALSVNNNKLTKFISKGTTLYRARVQNKHDSWEINCENLGAPPPHLARAGRMNPEGIAYLYLAMEECTALAETVSEHTTNVAVATFKAARDLQVIDFTNLPDRPSIFDICRHKELEELLFLNSFAHEISKHVDDAGKQIEYIPTQIVSEYLAHIFSFDDQAASQADGLLYKSSKHRSGVNLVLFPRAQYKKSSFAAVECLKVESRKIVCKLVIN